jgi:hypothetical protein
MLIKPRLPETNGEYFPYILPEISHIYNSFDTVIKQKYDNKFNTNSPSGVLIITKVQPARMPPGGRTAFIEIYFRDSNYLIGMHNDLVKQILDHAERYYINDKGNKIVIIDNKELTIPNLPDQFTSTEHNQLFIKGVLKSKFFIN